MIKHIEILKEIQNIDNIPKEDWLAEIHIYCIGNYTLNSWIPYLKFSFACNKTYANVDVSETNNIDTTVLDDNSLLYKNSYDILFLSIMPDLLDTAHTVDTKEWFPKSIERIQSWFNKLLSKITKKILVTSIPLSFHYKFDKIQKINISKTNNLLHKIAKKHENVCILDINKISNNIGFNNSYSLRDFNLFNNPLKHNILLDASRTIANINFNHKLKAIVVDCDNTLWYGIAGEDGPDSIECNKHCYPGNLFWSFQKQLLQLKEAGFILLLASKNNKEDVISVFESNPEFPLKFNDFATTRINWNEKHENISNMSKVLNLPTSSMIFIDDNELECGLVENFIPDILVKRFPSKDLSSIPFLLDSIREIIEFNVFTDEDKERTRLYQTEEERLNSNKNYKTKAEFLKSLDLKITFKIDHLQEIGRFVQLSQRTNQFNSTTRRFNQTEVRSIINDVSKLLISISVKDNFGEYGTSGFLVCEKLLEKECNISSFLLSCRILGKDLEKTILHEVINYLTSKYPLKKIKILYKKTRKNNPMYDFLIKQCKSPVQIDRTININFVLDRLNTFKKNIKANHIDCFWE